MHRQPKKKNQDNTAGSENSSSGEALKTESTTKIKQSGGPPPSGKKRTTKSFGRKCPAPLKELKITGLQVRWQDRKEKKTEKATMWTHVRLRKLPAYLLQKIDRGEKLKRQRGEAAASGVERVTKRGKKRPLGGGKCESIQNTRGRWAARPTLD